MTYTNTLEERVNHALSILPGYQAVIHDSDVEVFSEFCVGENLAEISFVFWDGKQVSASLYDDTGVYKAPDINDAEIAETEKQLKERAQQNASCSFREFAES